MRFLHVFICVFVALGITGCSHCDNLSVTNNTHTAITLRFGNGMYLGKVAAGKTEVFVKYLGIGETPILYVRNDRKERIAALKMGTPAMKSDHDGTICITVGQLPPEVPSSPPSPAFNAIIGLGLALAAYRIQITLCKRCSRHRDA